MPRTMLIARQSQRGIDRSSRVRTRAARPRIARRCALSAPFGARRPRIDAARIVCRQDHRQRIADRAELQQQYCTSARRLPLRRALRSESTFAGPHRAATVISRGLEHGWIVTATHYSAMSYEDPCRERVRPLSPTCIAPPPSRLRCSAVCRVAMHREDIDSRKPPSQLVSARNSPSLLRCCRRRPCARRAGIETAKKMPMMWRSNSVGDRSESPSAD